MNFSISLMTYFVFPLLSTVHPSILIPSFPPSYFSSLLTFNSSHLHIHHQCLPFFSSPAISACLSPNSCLPLRILYVTVKQSSSSFFLLVFLSFHPAPHFLSCILHFLLGLLHSTPLLPTHYFFASPCSTVPPLSSILLHYSDLVLLGMASVVSSRSVKHYFGV